MENEHVLDISWSAIIKVVLAAFIFYLIFLIRDILISFFFALIISFLFNPIINFLQKLKIPRFLAAVLVYLSAFAIFGFIVYWTAPMFFNEIQQFSQLFPQYFLRISPALKNLGIQAFQDMESFTVAIGDLLKKASSDIFSAVSVFFGGVASTLFILVLAFFISLEDEGVEKMIFLLTPSKYENRISSIWERSRARVAGWFGIRVLAGLFVAITFFIALYLFQIKYSLILALLSGILSFVPVIGAIISGFLVLILVGLESWLKAFFALVVLVIIYQIEGNILSPILTKKIIGFPPVMVLLALAIGGRLLGVLGAILAIPLAGIIFEFLKEFLTEAKQQPL